MNRLRAINPIDGPARQPNLAGDLGLNAASFALSLAKISIFANRKDCNSQDAHSFMKSAGSLFNPCGLRLQNWHGGCSARIK